MTQIEERPYHSDSTDEEIQMLRDRVHLLDEETIHFHEVPVMSDFAIDTTTDEIGRYLNNGKAHFLIINLTGVAPPNAPMREKLKECYSKYTDQIDHVAFYTGKNVLLNLIAKYMVRTVGYKKYSFHKTKDQALKAIANE